MRISILLCLALAGCGFGDNQAQQGPSAHCGDGVVDPGEGCDDGNTVNGDGCSSTCQVETASPVCGNGIVETGEQCDDGNTNDGDGCSSTCQGEGPPPPPPPPPPAVCALIPQAGCSGTTPACDLTAALDGTVECRAVTAQGKSNSHCALHTDCATGFTCVGDAAQTVEPWCMPYCAADTDCIGGGSRCVIGLDDPAGNPLDVTLCSKSCNPYAQSGCVSGLGCVAYADPNGDYTDCKVMGATADGGACTASTDCQRGSMCVTDGTTTQCASYCRVGDDTTCDTGTCTGFGVPLTIGTTEYGICL